MKGSLEAKGVYHDLSDQPMAVRAANLTDIPLPDRTLYIYIYIMADAAFGLQSTADSLRS